MTKSQKEIILVITLVILFIRLLSPQVVNITEKTRAIKAKMFLRNVFTAETLYRNVWSEYTGDIELLALEYPDILEWERSPEWELDLEGEGSFFEFTLTRVTDNSNYSGQTLVINQSGSISGTHRFFKY